MKSSGMVRLLALLVFGFLSLSVFAFQDGQVVRLVGRDLTVSAENSSLDVGSSVVLWTETGTHSQRWKLVDSGRGTFFLQNVYSEWYLGGISSATANSQIGQIARNNATTRGHWEIVPVEGKDGIYNIYMGTARRVALASMSKADEGSDVTLALASTADSVRIEWKVEVEESVERGFTKAIRDDMMEKWKAHYYHKASTGYVIGNGGWWGDAEMFEIVLDALETTGKKEYAEMFHNLYINFCQRNNTDWSGNDYNDDISWMCIACARAYLLTGNTEYRTRAKANFDKMYARANVYGNGTLVWKQGNSGTNSCINGPASVCASYLGIAFNSEAYFKKAAEIYAGQRSTLYNINSSGVFNGQVYDSYDTNNNKVSNTWSSTYNQGTSLGAAIMLYNHYGTEQYKDDADAIMKWTAQNLANSNDIIKVCQTVNGDLTGFKGILMRYVRKYAADLQHPEYYEWLAKNAYHAWNNRNSKGISMSAWLHKTTEDFYYSDGGNFNTDGVGAFTALSAAFNAHLGVKDSHEAYEKTEAEDFNFIRGCNVGPSDEEDSVQLCGQMENSDYAGYRRVDFGSRAASHIVVRAKALRPAAKLNIYADEPSATKGKLLCSVTAADMGGFNNWAVVEKELNLPVTGVRDIYIMAAGTAGRELMSVDWFQFDARNTVYGDITNNSGLLTVSASDETIDILNLTDDDVATEISLPCTEMAGGELVIRYDSPAPVLLKGYSVFSGYDKDGDISSWTLQGSTDGESWTNLHELKDSTFSVRAQRMKFDVSTTQEYTSFRLLIPVPESQKVISLSEWQLLGRSIHPSDITADGGTISEGAESLIDHIGNTTLAMPENVVYDANGTYRLTAYSLTCAEQSAPQSWVLEGSSNGRTWEEVDRRESVQFPYPGSTIIYNVSPTESYPYYRLSVQDQGAALQQWQLFGEHDFGTYYADITALSQITSSDGSPAAALIDDNGYTTATVEGESMYWELECPIAVKPLSFSVVSAADVTLDPDSIIVDALDDEGNIVNLSTRTLSFANRGDRITFTMSNSKTFSKFRIHVKTLREEQKVCLADIELYGAVLADEESALLHLPAEVNASAESISLSEVVAKLNDQNRNTRYHAYFSEPCEVIFSYEQPIWIDTYALTAARDNASYDPKAWTLEGSVDGENWTLIDSRADVAFSNRYATQFYSVQPNEAYSQYRLTVSEVNGGAHIQIGEWQLLKLFTGNDIASAKDDLQKVRIAVMDDCLQIESPSAAEVAVYDLQGRKLSAAHIEPGLNSLPAKFTQACIVVVRTDKFSVSKKILK